MPARLVAGLALAVCALGQTPEIRGTITEQGTNAPLPGAEVALYEFVPNGDTLDARLFKSVSSDARGTFAFQPGHLGDFRLEVRKPGYVTLDNSPRNPGGPLFKLQLFLDATHPAQDFRVTFMMPASLTGRVVDEDRKPVANFRIFVMPADSLLVFGRGVSVITDADGVFTAEALPPGPYIVRTAPESMQGISVAAYTEAESKVVDEAYETAYWPGGVTTAEAALPIPVPPGSPANLGTIVMRKAKYYRANIEFAGDCNAEEWTFTLLKLPIDPRLNESRFVRAPCRTNFQLRNLPPGAYSLAMTTGAPPDLRWALTPLTITRENVQARVMLSPTTKFTARFLTLDAKPLPRVGTLTLRPEEAPSGVGISTISSGDGSIINAPNLPWARYTISVLRLPRTHYIKELRYNHQPVTDGAITLAPGAELEILLDDRPASISGTVPSGPNVAVQLRRWPPVRPAMPEGSEPYSYLVPANPDGTFELPGLAPGEYRIRTVNLPLFEFAPADGEKITLEVGEHKVVQLKSR